MYDYVQIVDKKLCYNQGYIVEFFLLGDSLASEFCADVSEHSAFFHFHRWCKQEESSCLHDNVPKSQHIKFRRRGITQNKEYNIRNTAKVWNQEGYIG